MRFELNGRQVQNRFRDDSLRDKSLVINSLYTKIDKEVFWTSFKDVSHLGSLGYTGELRDKSHSRLKHVIPRSN